MLHQAVTIVIQGSSGGSIQIRVKKASKLVISNYPKEHFKKSKVLKQFSHHLYTDWLVLNHKRPSPFILPSFPSFQYY